MSHDSLVMVVVDKGAGASAENDICMVVAIHGAMLSGVCCRWRCTSGMVGCYAGGGSSTTSPCFADDNMGITSESVNL